MYTGIIEWLIYSMQPRLNCDLLKSLCFNITVIITSLVHSALVGELGETNQKTESYLIKILLASLM